MHRHFLPSKSFYILFYTKGVCHVVFCRSFCVCSIVVYVKMNDNGWLFRWMLILQGIIGSCIWLPNQIVSIGHPEPMPHLKPSATIVVFSHSLNLEQSQYGMYRRNIFKNGTTVFSFKLKNHIYCTKLANPVWLFKKICSNSTCIKWKGLSSGNPCKCIGNVCRLCQKKKLTLVKYTDKITWFNDSVLLCQNVVILINIL